MSFTINKAKGKKGERIRLGRALDDGPKVRLGKYYFKICLNTEVSHL